ncbi:hypothetical protein HOR75_gp08 [Shewanella phage SppYZU05]|uniref:Uncharacterized protein n=1 Tax=Shewanella phage SppYZU05 TaxID=1970795 RepID=A0A1W6JTD6_9CAUD|nr:hypothetical protein HOR75_gp08 [Shewanella phage SppYZU05]ARM70534.1 hypothetical protein SppYZU05_08 [Shewanella phage SppYZU05]
MFGRVVRVEARHALDGDPFFVTEDLRVAVDMDIGLAQQIAQASVIIYNLSLESAKELTSGDLEVGSVGDGTQRRQAKRVFLRVFAGYKDERMENGTLPLLLEGVVMNASSRRALPEYITQLFVVPLSARFLRQTFPAYTSAAGGTLKSSLEEIMQRAGYLPSELTFDMPDELLSQSTRGMTFEPKPDVYSLLNRMGQSFSFTYSTRAEGVGFYPRLDDSGAAHSEFNYLQENGQAYEVSPILMRGTPMVGTATITIPLNFDARIFPGWVIDTQLIQGTRGDVSLPSEGLAEYSGIGASLYYVDDVAKYTVLPKYMVLRVVHKIDTHSDTWLSTIIGTVPSTGDQSKGETRG